MPRKSREGADASFYYPPELLNALRQLANDFGVDEIRKATADAFAASVGRRAIDDLSLARGRLIEEGRRWVQGDALDKRGLQQRIAMDVAKQHPGHGSDATRDRIRGKLRGRWKAWAIILVLPELTQDVPVEVLKQKLEEARRLEPQLAPLLDHVLDVVEDVLTAHLALVGERDLSLSLVGHSEAIKSAIGNGIGAL